MRLDLNPSIVVVRDKVDYRDECIDVVIGGHSWLLAPYREMWPRQSPFPILFYLGAGKRVI